MSRFAEYRFYSMLHDADMVRVSLWDARGDEYFALVEDGRGYGDRRKEAVEFLEQAIDDQKLPGEQYPWGCLIDRMRFNTQHLRARGKA